MHVLAIAFWVVVIVWLAWYCCTHKWSNGRRWK